jgi:adenylate kinase
VIAIFLGPPGAGKGTQSSRIAARRGVPQISTGDMLRQAAAEGTPLGRKAKTIMEAGELLPDAVIVDLIRERISRPDCAGGFLLDGFPRTSGQAEALDRMLAERGLSVDAVVNLDVDEAKLVERMAGRAKNEGRADDNPDTIRERLRVYREKTAPLVSWFENKGRLVTVDGLGEIGEVSRRIEAALGTKAGGARTAGALS